ncbi:MAG: amino acid ABC transporter permease [Hyphomicrobiales bacterium]
MTGFVRTQDAPTLPPPAAVAGLWADLRSRIFPTPLSAVAGLAIAAVVIWVAANLVDWALIRAVWSAPDRELCNAPGAGACWPFAFAKFHQWMYGFYPFEERWRVNTVFILGLLSLAALLVPAVPGKRWSALFFFVAYPVITFVLFVGGMLGLPFVETTQWGGLMVTLVLSITSMVVSVPLGILLALGRRSTMPIVGLLSTIFIEVVRGVPLVLVLFMAANMFPLFMPPGINPDKLLIAVIGMALFASAYMAEIIRGGLQAIPKGQYEGAQAVGLTYWKMMGLIIMPQVIRIVIPSIVNHFISLFKDTSLVTVVGILDLLGMVQTGFNDAKWASAQTGNTGYFLLAAIYWLFCFGMSRYSQFIERKLATGYKR